MQGDIGSPGDCARAAAGCSKAVYAATARSTVAADLEVADKRGVRNVVNALLDARNAAAVGAGVAAGAAGVGVKRALWKFSYAGDADAWAPDPAPASVAADLARALRFAAPPVELGQVATGELRWAGRVLARGAASASAPLPPLALAGGDGVTFRARGDGRARYACVVLAGDAPEEEEEGGAGEADGEGGGAAAAAPPRRARGPAPRWFGAAFTPRRYYTPFRLAFDAFVPLDGGPPARLDPAAALRLGFRFDSRAQPAAAAAAAPPQQQQRAQAAEGAARGGGGGGPAKPPRAGRPGEALSLMAELAAARAGLAKEPRGGGGGAGRGFAEPDANAFALEVAFVKLLPGGAEPDFVLVSCASGDGGGGGGGPGGVGPGPGRTPAQAAAVVEAKRWAEAALRGSGLGYTVVRPGRLSDSPGGGSPLLFDQSGRLGGDIAAADVADVCLRALHDGGARNTSFDVAREPPGQAGAAAYELVAQVASPALGGGNYLAPALAQLEKNT